MSLKMARSFEGLSDDEKQVIIEWSQKMGVREDALVSSFNDLDLGGEPVWFYVAKAATELVSARAEVSQPRFRRVLGLRLRRRNSG